MGTLWLDQSEVLLRSPSLRMDSNAYWFYVLRKNEPVHVGILFKMYLLDVLPQ